MKVSLLLVLILLICTGCSTEPSESDLTEAAHVQYADFNARTNSMTGGASTNSQFVVHSVKKVSCTPLGSSAYSCDAEIDVTEALLGRHKTIKTIKLKAVGSDWEIANVF
ncbi:hypothetical protein PAGU2595_028810 [Lysobacter xanthus]